MMVGSTFAWLVSSAGAQPTPATFDSEHVVDVWAVPLPVRHGESVDPSEVCRNRRRWGDDRTLAITARRSAGICIWVRPRQGERAEIPVSFVVHSWIPDSLGIAREQPNRLDESGFHEDGSGGRWGLVELTFQNMNSVNLGQQETVDPWSLPCKGHWHVEIRPLGYLDPKASVVVRNYYARLSACSAAPLPNNSEGGVP